jgi:ribosome-binding factor A
VSGRRQDRLAAEIRDEIARMATSELKDPRLGFVTLTRVELTPDLRYARVFVGVLGTAEERKRSLAALESASGFVRREIGRRLRLRFAPEIDFQYDRGLDAADKVARLLEEATPAAAEAADGPGEDDPGEGGPGEGDERE